MYLRFRRWIEINDKFILECAQVIQEVSEVVRRARFFAEPTTARQRQYEALRAFFLDGLTSKEVARRFGYSHGAFRILCHDFRRGLLPDFFTTIRPGPREQPKKSKARDQVLALRKRNYSIYDISRALKQQGITLSATAVREILAAEGFAPLPRRLDEERPVLIGPTTEAVADVRAFALSPREFTTRVGGLFLFVPDLIRLDCEALARNAKLPGSLTEEAGQGSRKGRKAWKAPRCGARRKRDHQPCRRFAMPNGRSAAPLLPWDPNPRARDSQTAPHMLKPVSCCPPADGGNKI